MNGKYKELTEERKALPRNADGNRLSAVIKPLLDCLDHAFEKLEEDKARKAGGGGAGGGGSGGGGTGRPTANKGGWVVAGDDQDDDSSDDEGRGGWAVVR